MRFQSAASPSLSSRTWKLFIRLTVLLTSGFAAISGHATTGIDSVSDDFRFLPNGPPFDASSEILNSEFLKRVALKLNFSAAPLSVSNVRVSCIVDKLDGGVIGVTVDASALRSSEQSAAVDTMMRYLTLRALGFSQSFASSLVFTKVKHHSYDDLEKLIIRYYPVLDGAEFIDDRTIRNRSALMLKQPRTSRVMVRGILDGQIAFIFEVRRGRVLPSTELRLERRDAKEFNRRLFGVFHSACRFADHSGILRNSVSGFPRDSSEWNRKIKAYLKKRGIKWEAPEDLNLPQPYE